MGITHNCQYGYYPYYIIYLGDKMFERIRDLREDNDLKQKDLASYLSVDQSTYSDYENGRINVPVVCSAPIRGCYWPPLRWR